MEFAIAWLGIAVATSVVARIRGLGASTWFILGLVFSVFALIAALVLKKRDPDTPYTDAQQRLIFWVHVAFFPVMVAMNTWLFLLLFDQSYLAWYIANGAFIGIVAALFATISKNIKSDEYLISSNPMRFVSANLMLLSAQVTVTGHYLLQAGNRICEGRSLQVQNEGSTSFSDFFDSLVGALMGVLMVCALGVWFLAIVPMQYFVVLIAGAPARLALKLKGVEISEADRPVYGRTGDDDIRYWEKNLVAEPVSLSNAMAALLLLAVKLSS